jgi:Ca2+-binding EF-hand superfamily protein
MTAAVLAIAGGAALAQGESTFLTLDENRDGALSRAEAQGMRALAARFGQVDEDASGTLSRYEFNTFMSQPRERAAPSFASLDADGDGALAKDEVIGSLPGLAAGFDIADRNDDRRLDAAEFQDAMALSANMYGEGRRSAHKRDIFRSLDMNDDGAISRDEARYRPDIARNFGEADRNRDGQIGVSEFGLISMYTLGSLDENPFVPGRTHERFSFGDLDLNRDGHIARTEAAFRADLARNFSDADADGDGAVSPGEFRAWTR